MKILVVDDATSVLQVMASRRRAYGYAVFQAHNGHQALDLLPHVNPDKRRGRNCHVASLA